MRIPKLLLNIDKIQCFADISRLPLDNFDLLLRCLISALNMAGKVFLMLLEETHDHVTSAAESGRRRTFAVGL